MLNNLNNLNNLRSVPRFCERFCIGLTGGIASGKSTVAHRLAELGAAIVDTDVIAHDVTKPNGQAMPLIAQAFGEQFINRDGSLNRPLMREYVFQNLAERQRLESILHPMIQTIAQQQAANAVGAYVVFVVPLLIESKVWLKYIDCCVVVDCEPSVQIQRLMHRSQLSLEHATQILAAQISREQRLQHADKVLYNTSNKAQDHTALIIQIDRLHQQFSQQSLA